MLSRTAVFKKLKENGLKRNTHDRKDYILGKALFQNGSYMFSQDHENLVRWLIEYFEIYEKRGI